MKVFSPRKVLSALPDPLVADAMYAVRVGDGFDLYIVDSTGAIAYKVNGGAAATGELPFFLADTTRAPIALTIDGALPFFLAGGSASNIPLTT